MADEYLDRAKRLMSKPEQIRNICTSAHIHHGKCISKDSRIILADGQIVTAKEIYDRAKNEGSKFEEKEEHTIYDLSKKDIQIFSLNKETGKLEKKKIELAWKLKGGKTIKIRLRNGFEITTTPEHKYIVLENMDFAEKQAHELKLGDNIVCARSTKTENNLDIKNEILNRLREKNFYVCPDKNFGEELKTKILNFGIKELCLKIRTNLKTKSFYHGVWQNRYQLSDLLNIAELFNINDVYDNISTLVFRTGKQRGGNSNPIKLPQNFEELFYLAGLFIGDGSNKRFIVGKESLGKEFLRICNNLGFQARPKNDPGKTPAFETNKTLIHILNSLFDYPLKKKSHNIKVSNFVFKSPNNLVAKLLKGYFDCDGTVERARSAISITSVSSQMIKDLSLLLLRFNIVPIVNGDTLYISGFSAKEFIKNIGFFLEEKQNKAIKLANASVGSYVTDWVNIETSTRVSPNDTQKLIQLGAQEQTMSKCFNEDLVYLQVSSIEEGYEEEVYDFTIPDNHNFIAEGMVIHNTALTDNLLASSGFMSKKAAGSLEAGMATWLHLDEQERLMTVDAANLSMVHEFNGQEYLINMIDTPGHVDFGGNVTRAMRAIDGTIAMVCAVEGIMPQTETVIRQALRERVKPVLFINKCDRLIMELKLTPEQIQERIMKIILAFNRLIERIAEPEYKSKWQVSITDGSVAFGSARENWAMSFPFMKKKNIGFKDILKIYDKSISEEDQQKWIWENAPLNEVVLDMVIKHMPNPKEAQAYRVPHIWKGDLESPFGKSLMNCDPKGKVGFVITRITIDPKFGREISAGRLYSGTVKEGATVYLNNAKVSQRVSQVYTYLGVKPEALDEVPAGNIIALGGVSGYAGETITEEPDHPFEELKHIFEPVITKSIEPSKPQDLPKLVEILRKVAKEDPSIKVEINQETGENLISGMGELHLEIIENRIITERNFQIKTSPPIVVYRESIAKQSQEVEGKSPNKHNKFYVKVKPQDAVWSHLIKEAILRDGRVKKNDSRIYQELEKHGIPVKEARKIRAIYNGNILMDETRGIVHIGEVQELINDAFEQVMKEGPIAKEPCTSIFIEITDCKLHEDAIHRGPAQVYPAVREGIKQAMVDAELTMFEPYQVLQIDATSEYMGAVTRLVQNKRGQLLDVNHEEDNLLVKAKMPVGEMFGFAAELRSATEGKGNFFILDQEFNKIPRDLQAKIVSGIRNRKGLRDELNLS
ncbi:MAG: elongation factor EF-2 [Candidatus Nanoarchaeia archaeon]|nr:elongation factor EF-2 [Candidatus Nanoarchaeia archaeon]